jgi:prolyl-tRNA editing enzyme YbaK/EbsC (Cys-tRNA(Pro) deacylase)
MRSRKLDPVKNQKRLEMFFDALLGVKANTVSRTLFLQLQQKASGLQIILRFLNPLLNNQQHVMRIGHRALFLHVRLAKQLFRQYPVGALTPQVESQ